MVIICSEHTVCTKQNGKLLGHNTRKKSVILAISTLMGVKLCIQVTKKISHVYSYIVIANNISTCAVIIYQQKNVISNDRKIRVPYM